MTEKDYSAGINQPAGPGEPHRDGEEAHALDRLPGHREGR